MLDAVHKEIKAKRELLKNKKKERKYLETLAHWQENLMLIPPLFEQEFNLTSLEEGQVSFEAIDGALECSAVHQEVSRRESPLIPKGDSLQEQVLSLLPACVDKMAAIGEIILGRQAGSTDAIARQGIQRLEAFFADLGISTRLREIVSDPDELPHVCEMAVNDACLVTNPREATVEDMLDICKASW